MTTDEALRELGSLLGSSQAAVDHILLVLRGWKSGGSLEWCDPTTHSGFADSEARIRRLLRDAPDDADGDPLDASILLMSIPRGARAEFSKSERQLLEVVECAVPSFPAPEKLWTPLISTWALAVKLQTQQRVITATSLRLNRRNIYEVTVPMARLEIPPADPIGLSIALFPSADLSSG